MLMTASDIGVTFDLPDSFSVESDGSVFGPDGIDFAAYVEDASAAKASVRREIIEGRCYVEEFSHEEQTADGWLALFTLDDGQFGFELGRSAGRHIVFWSDHLPDEKSRELVLAACRAATIA